MKAHILTTVFILLAFSFVSPAATQLTVTAVNLLPLARASQTIELTIKDLAPLNEKNLNALHVKDSTGQEILCQSVDTNFDPLHLPDLLIFQADFAPNETKTFTVIGGAKREYKKDDFRAYGRFVRERFDDFAWENDLIAHRMYGQALETWPGEPLTSSGVDIWSKRTPRMVIDEWYMVDNYHADAGDGCDDYSVGTSRGCGGTGLWLESQLYVSKNFTNSRVLANGPIRVLFELDYPPFKAGSLQLTETKRISLDAGSQLDHFQGLYTLWGGFQGELPPVAIGLKKVRGEDKEFNAPGNWLASWQPMEKNLGRQGVALILESKSPVQQAEDAQNNLLLVTSGRPVSWWAGFAWDRAGRTTNSTAWKKYVDEFARGLHSPISLTVTPN